MKHKLLDGWDWKELGEISEKPQYGYTTSANKNGDYPLFVRTTDIKNGEIKWEKVPFCKEPPKDEQKYQLKSGDILVSRAGSVGESVVIKNPSRSVFASYLIRLRLKNSFNPNYVGYFLRSKFFKLQMEGFTSGTTLKGLNATNLSKIKIPLPSLEIQHKIVAILQKAEETKKVRAQADELTQQLLQSIFLEMFGDPVINSKGWNTKKLEKLCSEMLGGGTPSKSKPEYYKGEIPWVTPKDMKQDFIHDSIDHISENAIKESSTKIIPFNSLLMVIRSGILKKKLPIAINLCEVTLNQDMKGFVFDKMAVNPLFMLHYFKIYQKYLLKRVRSVTADNLEFKQIKNIDVIVPPIELQNDFAIIVEKLKQINEHQQNSSHEIYTLFNALMQKAFTGDLIH